MTFELFLTEPYFQTVLVTAIVVAATAATIGVFLVQRSMALFGDGIAHMSFAGIALGFVTGWLPLVAALGVATVGALAVQQVQRRGWARSDAALGLVYTASLAFGVVLVSSQGSVPPNVDSYLFGNLLLAGRREFFTATAAAVLVAVSVAFLWRPFVLLCFGEERARVQGLPASALNTVFTLLCAFTVVATVRVVGVLLVSGLIIIPAAAAARLARSMLQAVAFSIAIAVTAVVVGLGLSAEFSWASGATITLVAAGLFVATGLVPKRG